MVAGRVSGNGVSRGPGAMSPVGALGACESSAGEELRPPLTEAAILPVIKAARFPDALRSGTLTVRERVFAPAVREECHVDPQTQPKPNAVIIVTSMQRATVALAGATILMLLIRRRQVDQRGANRLPAVGPNLV